MTEIQEQALIRATTGASTLNHRAIYDGFQAKGIALDDIIPRINVLTFNAWKAKGRSVKKGEHGVKVFTFVECEGSTRDPSNGETTATTYRRPSSTTVFHISQTESTSERSARFADKAEGKPFRGWKNENGRQVHDHVLRDPGEDAADRWTETR